MADKVVLYMATNYPRPYPGDCFFAPGPGWPDLQRLSATGFSVLASPCPSIRPLKTATLYESEITREFSLGTHHTAEVGGGWLGLGA